MTKRGRTTQDRWWSRCVVEVVFVAVSPGGVFVVAGVVFEAAVEDADEAIAECSQGPVV